jgi:hypothetical protein
MNITSEVELYDLPIKSGVPQAGLQVIVLDGETIVGRTIILSGPKKVVHSYLIGEMTLSEAKKSVSI